MTSSTWKKWDAKQYLLDFYGGNVSTDEIETISFLAQLAKNNPQHRVLDFGCGPTLHHIFPFVPYVSEIHVADLLKSNLFEVSKFINNDSDAHNWDKYIEYALICEGNKKPNTGAIAERRLATSQKITKVIEADAREVDPMGIEFRGSYPIVISCFCADSATDNHEEFSLFIRNIATLVQSGGLFVIACLRDASFYRTKESHFPSARVIENTLEKILKNHFIHQSVKIDTKHLPEHREQGYTGIILASAIKG